MSSPSSPVVISSDDEIVPESPLVTPLRSPKFMPISADRTEEIKFSEEFDLSEDESEPIKEKTKDSDDESQPTATLPTLAETGSEVTALRLRLGQGEQRIAELEQQVATMRNVKRKWEENSGESSGQQQGRRQKTVKVYAAGPDDKKKYKGKKPHCNKCNRHHTGHCGTSCGKCERYGHQTKDCRSTAPTVKPAATPGTPRSCYKCGQLYHSTKGCRAKPPASNQVANNPNNRGNPRACYECGGVGHFKAQCGNLKNQNNNKNNSTQGSDK